MLRNYVLLVLGNTTGKEGTAWVNAFVLVAEGQRSRGGFRETSAQELSRGSWRFPGRLILPSIGERRTEMALVCTQKEKDSSPSAVPLWLVGEELTLPSTTNGALLSPVLSHPSLVWHLHGSNHEVRRLCSSLSLVVADIFFRFVSLRFHYLPSFWRKKIGADEEADSGGGGGGCGCPDERERGGRGAG